MMTFFDRQNLATNNYRRAVAFVLGSLGIAALVTPMNAASIAVPNASFESPTVSPPPAIPFLDNWQKTDEPAGFDPASVGGYPWTALSGVFVGGPSNTDGDQAAYLFTLPGVGISQELTETYQAGLSYNLTVGIHGGGFIAEGDQVQLGLYYLDQGSLTPIVNTVVTYSTTTFPDSEPFYDFDLNLPTVQAGDAWAGQNIGIEFLSVTGVGSGSWDLDNVRLTTVPEPSTWLLLTSGLGCGLIVANRRKKVRNLTTSSGALK